MKVLVIGADWYGSLGRMCRDGFLDVGCEAHLFDYRRQPRATWLQVRGLHRLSRVYHYVTMNRRLLKKAITVSPDILLVLKGELIRPATLEAAAAHTSARLVHWNSDSPFNPLNTTQELLESIPLYDCCFIWSRMLVKRLPSLGAKRAAYLPFGYDPRMHHPVELGTDELDVLATDVCFCGTWEPERERLLTPLVDFGLGIWGNGWERLGPNSPLRACWRGPAVYGEDLSRVYSASRIVLNFLREQNKGAHNMRTFEIPATGAFQLATRSEEHLAWFAEGREIAFFETFQELISQVAYYLEHDTERDQIAQSGHRRLEESRHTYADRMEQLLDEVKRL